MKDKFGMNSDRSLRSICKPGSTMYLFLCVAIFPALITIPCAGRSHILKAEEMENATFRDTVLEDGVLRLGRGPSISGVYVVSQQFTQNEKKALEFDWIDGISIRTTWAKVEPEKDAYNWELFDRVVESVKTLNKEKGTTKTVQLRVMDGVWSPEYLKDLGVTWLHTTDHKKRAQYHPCPIDNPVLVERLRKLYRTMALRYLEDQQTVAMIHGTWLGGLWAEIFIPDTLIQLPNYSNRKMLDAMKGVIDIYFEEVVGRGYVTELPFSGIYNPSSQAGGGREKIRITDLADYISQRLGNYTPWFHINDCSVGQLWNNKKPVYDRVKTVLNVGYQMQGANNWKRFKNGERIYMSGDYLDLFKTKRPVTDMKPYYMEIYTEDIYPETDQQHRIVEACAYYREFLQTLPPLRKRTGTFEITVDLKEPNTVVQSIFLEHDGSDETGVQWKARRHSSRSGETTVLWGGAGNLPSTSGRFLDIRLTFTTDNCRISPSVRAIRVETR